jgi:hypothetical protein
MTSGNISLLAAVVVGLGVISMGVWRIAAAVLALASKVDLLAYRIEQIEKRQAAMTWPIRRTR